MKNLVIYENFGQYRENDESEGLSLFEQACIEEGVDFGDFNDLSEDEFEYDESELNEGKFGDFLKKALKTVGPLVKQAGLTILKNSGLPMSGAIAGILDKVTAGIGKIKDLKGAKAKDFGTATKDNSELNQVQQVAKKTLDKLSTDLQQRGTEAMFDPKNRESVGNLLAIYNATHAAKNEIQKNAPKETASASKPAAKAGASASPIKIG